MQLFTEGWCVPVSVSFDSVLHGYVQQLLFACCRSSVVRFLGQEQTTSAFVAVDIDGATSDDLSVQQVTAIGENCSTLLTGSSSEASPTRVRRILGRSDEAVEIGAPGCANRGTSRQERTRFSV